MILEADDFGNVRKQVQIGYGRRNERFRFPLQIDRDKQTENYIIYTENLFTNYIDFADAYRTSLPCESVIYELTGYDYTADIGRFTDSDFVKPDPTDPIRFVKYEDKPTDGKQRRPIEHVRTFYRKNDLSAILPLKEMESLALAGDGYKLVFTPGLIDRIYKRPHPETPIEIENLLPIRADALGGHGAGNGGYMSSQDLKAEGLFPIDDPDDHWWVPSGRIFILQILMILL